MKKTFISYIFIIFLLSSFSIFAEREVDYQQLKYDEKTGLIYFNGEKEAFTGIAKDYYKDKRLKSEIPYQNGKLEGTGKEYYPSGKLKSEAIFVDGLLQGKAVGYYENGNLEYEENYKDGKLDGLTKDYFKSGKIKAEVNYKNDELDGPAKEYYENGQIFIQESYKDGELDGESLNFYENGDLKIREVYNNGELIESSNKDIEEVSVSSKSQKTKEYIGIFIFCTIIIGFITYTIFKMTKAFPKTNHLTDEQRSKIFKILMKYDEGKKELFSSYRLNGVGTGYYRVRSMMVDNEKVYIYAKMCSFFFIPIPITLGYLLCYNKDQILASFSNVTFKEAKKEIEETILYL